MSFFDFLILIKEHLFLCKIKRHIFDDRVPKGMVYVFTKLISFFLELLELLIAKILFLR